MKKVWLRFPLILLALLALTHLGQQFYRDWNHVTVGGVEYPLELEELDLSGQPIGDIKELPKLFHLKKLDLRNTGITPEQIGRAHV